MKLLLETGTCGAIKQDRKSKKLLSFKRPSYYVKQSAEVGVTFTPVTNAHWNAALIEKAQSNPTVQVYCSSTDLINCIGSPASISWTPDPAGDTMAGSSTPVTSSPSAPSTTEEDTDSNIDSTPSPGRKSLSPSYTFCIHIPASVT